MIRGIEKRRIFLCDEDRFDFVERLERLLPEEQWRCFAWVLMPNHVHLVLQGRHGRLSRLMARLNTGYARGFNERHDRCGYLFQNRFRSRVVHDDDDLLGVVLYVLRNPLEPGLVDSAQELESYAWCALGGLLGKRTPRPFEAAAACLSLFAEEEEHARARLRSWLGSDKGPSCDARPAPSPKIRSSTEPAATLCLDEHSGGEPSARLAALIEAIGEQFELEPHAVTRPASRGDAARARALIAHLATEDLRIPGTLVAATLGISPSAVSHAARRGRRLRRENE